MDAIEIDITPQLDQFNKMAKSMTFITSKALNDVAFDKGRKSFANEMGNKFENRNKFFNSARAIRIKKANVKDLSVTLYHFKEELGLQQFGGIETPKGKKLAVPIRRTFAKYANVPENKKIPKALKIDTVMARAPRNRGEATYTAKRVKPFIGNRGVFIRTDEGLRLLYTFVDEAKHRKKLLEWQKNIELVYNTNLERYLNRNYLRLLKG